MNGSSSSPRRAPLTALLAALLLAAACVQEVRPETPAELELAPTPTQSGTPVSTPTATVTETATRTVALPPATPTASSVPPAAPTATRPPLPAPTAPPPRPATAAPGTAAQAGQLRVLVTPAELPQGGAFSLTVESDEPLLSVTARLDGRPLVFQIEGARAWTVAGFRSDVAPGRRTLAVSAQAAAGRLLTASAAVDVGPGRFPVEQIIIEPGDDGEDLLAAEVLRTEWTRLLGITSRVTPQPRWEGPFRLPAAGPVTSVYGTRRAYNGGPPGSPHEGMDLGVAAGTPVFAANGGTVVVAQTWKVRGNAVIIDHGMGLFSGYYHLSRIDVQEGQVLAKGQALGKSGDTGLATGPHLHWEVVLQGMHTQPLQWTQRCFP